MLIWPDTFTRSLWPGAVAGTRVLEHFGCMAEIAGQSLCCGRPLVDGGQADPSMAAARRALLPALRAAPSATLILADGFSCREQSQQATLRNLRLAEALAMGLPQHTRADA